MAMDPMRALKARMGAARYALVTNRFLQQGALCMANGCTILTFRIDGYVDLSSAAGCHAMRFGPKESDSTARLMLDQYKNSQNYSTMSAVQASALADMLSTAELEPDRKLELLGLLVTVPWACDEHAHRVMEPLASDDTAAAQRGKRRRALQDYKAFVHYFSESMWESLNDTAISPDAKLTCMLQFLVRLGLRLPTEHTVRLMASLWMMVSNRSLDTIDTISRTMNFKHVKSTFDTLRLKCPDPVSWVVSLPMKPVELLRDFPSVYSVAFTGTVSPAAVPKINIDVLHAFDLSYSCRGGLKNMVQFGGGTSLASFGSGPAMPVRAGSVCGPFGFQEQPPWMAASMQFMQSMMNSQQRVIELISSSGASGSGGPVRSLAALEDRCLRQPELQRALPLALGGTAQVEELVETPPKQNPHALVRAFSVEGHRAAIDATVQESETCAVLALPTEKVPADDPIATSAVQDVAELMFLLQERKEAAAVASKEAKKDQKAKKATGTDTMDNLPIEKKKYATVAKAKCAAKLAGKIVGKGAAKPNVAKELAPEVATKPAPKVATKPSPKVAAAGKAAAKGALTSKGGGKRAGSPLVLGCSKCRWSEHGCGQCKKASYIGFRWNSKVES